MSRSQKVSGTFFAMAIVLFFLPLFAGCSDDCNECPVPVVNNAPPFPPDGVYSVTGDGMVTICWNPNWEEDLAGYAVYYNDEEYGQYEWLADVPADQTCYDDTDVVNGDTWFYAVLAFDRAGNESELSYETVFDTPRPEGFNVVLMEYLGQNADSGWDFDTQTRQASDDNTTDIYFGVDGGVGYIYTNAGVDIQDYGFIDLIDVDWAPSGGWAESNRVEAIDGHSYIIRIGAGGGHWNVAKIEVISVTSQNMTMNWAYQEVLDLPELVPGGGTSQ